MTNFVLAINTATVSSFDKVMDIINESNGKIKFIPQAWGVNQGSFVTTAGMNGPDDKGMYHSIRIEFSDDAIDKALDILKVFSQAVPAKS